MSSEFAIAASLKPPKLRFATSIFYFLETDRVAVLQVLRIGPLQARSTACWVTEDCSATAGQVYEKTSGVVTFEPGEVLKLIEVGIAHSYTWTNTLEFKVRILEAGLENCATSRGQSEARVRIINVYTFPGRIFKDNIVTEETLDKTSGFKMMREYVWFNLTNPIVRRGFRKMCVIEQLHNFSFLAQLFMNVYFIDFVLINENEDVLFGDKNLALVMIVVVQAFFFLLLWWLDRSKKFWKVGGTTRATIQVNLLRRFLMYSEPSLAQVTSADLIMAITRDTTEVAHNGFMRVLGLSRDLGRIIMIFVFNILSVAIFGKDGALLLTTIAFFGIPIALLACVVVRMKQSHIVRERNQHAQNAVIRYLDYSVANLDLIGDYNKRPETEDKFAQLVRAYNGTNALENVRLLTSKTIPEALALFVVLLWTVVGGRRVINDRGTYPIGLFLAALSTLRTLGSSWAGVYDELTEISHSLPSLRRISLYLNFETTSLAEKDTREARLAHNTQNLKQMDSGTEDDTRSSLDDMHIRVLPLSFGFGEVPNLSMIEFAIPQGKLISVVGHHRVGKTTFLQLLSGLLHIAGQPVIVPSHLRVIRVARNPMFVSGTIMDNLLFGATANSEDTKEARVLAIFQRLLDASESERVMKLAKDKDARMKWGKVLSCTECHALCLARALVANPQVLVVNKPTQPYDEHGSARIMKCLKEFVTNRGVEHDPSKASKRRPHTCLLTAAKQVAVDLSDLVFEVTQVDGHSTMQYLDRDRASHLQYAEQGMLPMCEV